VSKARLEAFSDGVIAIIITIMVLELRPPEGYDLAALMHLSQELCAYILSFVILGIYWNNHHVLVGCHAPRQRRRPLGQPASAVLAVADAVRDGRGWGGIPNDRFPSRCMDACSSCRRSPTRSFRRRLLRPMDAGRGWRTRWGNDLKGRMSLACYAVAIVLAFANHWLSYALFIFVALIWLVPDRRISARANAE
jgi:hypothetical protein